MQAYHHAAQALRGLPQPVDALFRERGLEALEEIPGIGESIAHAIRDLLLHGRLAMLERMKRRKDEGPLSRGGGLRPPRS